MVRLRRMQGIHFLFVLCKKCFRAQEEQMKDCCWPLLFSGRTGCSGFIPSVLKSCMFHV